MSQYGGSAAALLHANGKIVLILIRWLPKKPPDMEVYCLHKRVNPGSAGQSFNP